MRARSTGDSSGSVSGLASRHAFTQLPNVPSLTPRSRATSAIGLPVSITSCTASALNCGLNFRRVSGMNRSSQLRVPVQDRWYTPAVGVALNRLEEPGRWVVELAQQGAGGDGRF